MKIFNKSAYYFTMSLLGLVWQLYTILVCITILDPLIFESFFKHKKYLDKIWLLS
jgi:hypothetical protein